MSSDSPPDLVGMRNRGSTMHNFSVPAFDLDLDIPLDERTHNVPIQVFSTPGTYEFFCKYHQDQGMTGTLTVS